MLNARQIFASICKTQLRYCWEHSQKWKMSPKRGKFSLKGNNRDIIEPNRESSESDLKRVLA